MTRFLSALALLLLLAAPVQAGISYPQDPVFNPLDPDETSPMQDMLILAEEGDARAQYILGDLYSKGKGGLAKDDKKAIEWFETAARNGYPEALVRLGAIARRQGKKVDALKWYSLAEQKLSSGPWRTQAGARREELVKDGKMSQDERDLARSRMNEWRAGAKRAAVKPKAEEEAAPAAKTPSPVTKKKEDKRT